MRKNSNSNSPKIQIQTRKSRDPRDALVFWVLRLDASRIGPLRARNMLRPASPRRPLSPLCLNNLAIPHSIDADSIDLHCYETCPSPTELAALALARPQQPQQPEPHTQRPADCFCLEDCPGPRCLATVALATRKRAPVRTPSPVRSFRHHHHIAATSDETWRQRLRIYHPGDFDFSNFTVESEAPFGAVFIEICRTLRVDRLHVCFHWHRVTRTGQEVVRALHDLESPHSVGMRKGHTQHLECEYRG